MYNRIFFIVSEMQMYPRRSENNYDIIEVLFFTVQKANPVHAQTCTPGLFPERLIIRAHEDKTRSQEWMQGDLSLALLK